MPANEPTDQPDDHTPPQTHRISAAEFRDRFPSIAERFPHPAPAAEATPSVEEQLRRLTALFDAGFLTVAQFAVRRARLHDHPET